jgi:hypothetical protein
VGTNRRRRSHKTSQYASVLAALADMWSHRPEPAEPTTEGRAPDGSVVSAGGGPQGPQHDGVVAQAVA